jgi:hypothetical protein
MPDAGFVCPHCSGLIEAGLADQPQVMVCPHCNQEMTLPPNEEAPSEAGDDLDGLRIQQISKLRRSAYRSRSYWLIGAAVLGVAAIELVRNAVTVVWRVGLGWRSVAEALGAGVAGYCAVRCYLRSEDYRREAERSALEMPRTPPDFSTLSDGRQSWKSLEQLHNENREPPP